MVPYAKKQKKYASLKNFIIEFLTISIYCNNVSYGDVLFRFFARCIFSFYVLAFNHNAVYSYTHPYSEIVVDANSGSILYANNELAQTQPASLAKMMTLYIVFKAIEKGRLKLDDRVVFSKNATKQSPSKLHMKVGTSISVREAIIALVVKSANDAAVALAETVAQDVTSFVQLMNCHAKMLGMNDTNFCNPSGWNCRSQCTTAADMAKLARALLINMKDFYSVFSIKQVKYCGSVIKNHNKVLGNLPGGIIVDGIKTGYVAASGYNLVASAKKIERGKEKRIIAIILGGRTGPLRDERMKHLLLCGFSKTKPNSVVSNQGHLIYCSGNATKKCFTVKNVGKQSEKRKSTKVR